LYRVQTYEEAFEQVAALPDHALALYAEAFGVLELAPWNGEPYHEAKPDGVVRQLVFGAEGRGFVIYLILEDQRRVDVLQVVWVG
jgi:hypothetical protein